MTQPKAIMPLIAAIEAELAAFYGFKPQALASDFLLSEEAAQLWQNGFSAASNASRGTVYVVQNKDNEELEVGIYLEPAIVKALAVQNPLTRLNEANLDPFWVLTEEISHFHLIINRASRGMPLDLPPIFIQQRV